MTLPIFKKFFSRFTNELSLRAGREAYGDEDEPVIVGSLWNDRLIVNADGAEARGGAGSDIVNTRGFGTVSDAGRGADTYVVGLEPGETFVEQCLVFDQPGGRVASDSIVMKGFGAASEVADLGNGRAEISGPDGATAILTVKDDTGAPVAFETIKASLVFMDDDGVTTTGGGGRPLLIIAEDVEGEALAELLPQARSLRSDTLLTDETVKGLLHTGGGDDVITADLTEATANDVFEFNTGRGDDLLEIDLRGSDAGETSIFDAGLGGDDRLIFRLDASTTAATGKCFVNLEASIEGTTTLAIEGFGDRVEVFDRADGAVIFRDPDTGVSLGCYFCDDDGDLAAADLAESDKFLTDFTWIDPIA